jgi:uncharacterized membrane protein YfcA
MPWTWLFLPLLGAAGGFLSGLLGVGGGIIFIPVLSTLFEAQGYSNTEIVKLTLANSIALVFVSGLMGIYRQVRHRQFDWRRALRIGIPGAVVSWAMSMAINHGSWYRKEEFQMVFLLFLLISIANMIFGKVLKGETGEIAVPGSPMLKEFAVALLAGLVVSLSGLGGGIVMVPMFRMLLRIPMRQATALSLSIIPMLSLAPLLSWIFSRLPFDMGLTHTGYIVWPYFLLMTPGVMLFAPLGLKTSKKLPVPTLRIIFAALSIFILVKTLLEINHVSFY